ncbi:glycine cleavage system protein GcvH [Planctomicrobium sp. SH664]|uniref:glycine cleavage system protein GcvH n=1 Tax=Planctomicrobium sp. SH664 TaxID=3448125 RepID=UPI003F5CB86B
MSDPSRLKFSKTHEWVSVDGDVATMGISDFAVQALTDVVHLELPQTGRTVAVGDTMGEIESVKAVSDLYAPVAGEIIAVNEDLQNDLGQLSEDPFGKGWIAKIRMSKPADVNTLLSHADYVAQQDGH